MRAELVGMLLILEKVSTPTPSTTANRGPIGCKVNQRSDLFEQSFFMRVHFPYLQPFADINKRTSRLAANLPLFRTNLWPLNFLDVPEQSYSHATQGAYEINRVELLRDLYVWAHKRSIQEYLAIKQDLAEPDTHRLAWRDFIKTIIREVIRNHQFAPLSIIQWSVTQIIPKQEQHYLEALVMDALSRVHESLLARDGLIPSKSIAYKEENAC